METAAYCFVLSVSSIVLLSLFHLSFSDPQEIILIVVYKAFIFKNKDNLICACNYSLRDTTKVKAILILYHNQKLN